MIQLRKSAALLVLVCATASCPRVVFAQTSKPQKASTGALAICSFHHLGRCALDVAGDQLAIWTSPLHAQSHDLFWLLPFGAAVGTSLAYDTDTLDKVGTSQSRIDFGKQVSTAGSPYVYFGTSGLIYITGVAVKNPQLQETGRLGGEAVIDAVLLNEGIKLATQRDRPFQGNGNGDFWPHGTRDYNLDSSMPSAHATAAWAVAKVVSAEYPSKPWLKLAVYGAATTVSVARVLARDHFPSDVVVGSTFGYLIGTYVVHHHSEQFSELRIEPLMDQRSRATGVSLSIPPRLGGKVLQGLAHGFHRRGMLSEASGEK